MSHWRKNVYQIWKNSKNARFIGHFSSLALSGLPELGARHAVCVPEMACQGGAAGDARHLADEGNGFVGVGMLFGHQCADAAEELLLGGEDLFLFLSVSELSLYRPSSLPRSR